MPLELKYGGAIMVATPAEVVEKYREWIKHTPEGRFVAECAARNLWGLDLVCWCSLDQPCHADVLLEIANPRREREFENPYYRMWEREEGDVR